MRVVVLGHTGNTFCAGADLAEGSAASADPAEATAERSREMAALLRAIVEAPLPVIVAVDGHVRAGGMGLVAAGDIAVAGPRSTFALTEARIGVAPAIISLTLLPKLSARAAARYYLTGETFDAATAATIGLITTAADDVDAAVASLVADIGRGSPQGLAASKALTTAAVLDVFDRDADGWAPIRPVVRLRRSPRGHAGVPAEKAAELGVRIATPAVRPPGYLR